MRHSMSSASVSRTPGMSPRLKAAYISLTTFSLSCSLMFDPGPLGGRPRKVSQSPGLSIPTVLGVGQVSAKLTPLPLAHNEDSIAREQETLIEFEVTVSVAESRRTHLPGCFREKLGNDPVEQR